MSKPSNYNIPKILDQMSDELSLILKTKVLEDKDINDVAVIGIHSAGVWIAEALHERLNIQQPLGVLNISFYRDDFSKIGLHPQIKPSDIPFEIENKHIILVDDVLLSGRTTRAAMNEIFDYGRPDSITLAVLIDRGMRELPIEAHVIGFKEVIEMDSYFKLTKTNKQLELDIIKREQK